MYVYMCIYVYVYICNYIYLYIYLNLYLYLYIRYLANDMQFHLVAPLLVFPFVLSPTLGWALLAQLLIASTAANAIIAATKGYALGSPFWNHRN